MKKLLYILTATLMPLLVLAQTTTKNYIKSTTFQVETTTGSVSDDQKIETITYFDGLGRPIQSIAKQAGGNKEDLITPIAYDYFGRQKRDYLPYARTTSSLNFETSLEPDSYGDIWELNYFYVDKYPNDFVGLAPEEANPFSEKHLEASPLNRVREQGAPGASWRVNKGDDTDHTIKFAYNTNSESDNVKNFKVSFSGGNKQVPNLDIQGTYASLELYKTVAKNENWTSGKNNTTEEFKDKEGHIILKRTYSDYKDSTGQLISSETIHDTYYVYDIYGNLTYVIPPKATDLIGSAAVIQADLTSTAVVTSASVPLNITATNSIQLLPGFHAQAGSTFSAVIVNGSQTILDNLCYQYKYDNRNRLVEKKLPGKDWEYIVYDKLDRPILTQDVNLRANNKWLFIKYDAFGRSVYTGEYINAVQTTRVLVQNLANAAAVLFENKATTASNINGTEINYSNVAFPNSGIDLFAITYYDNYLNFDLDGGNPVTSYNKTPVTNPKGLPTATKIRALGTPLWTTTVNYYDNKGRGIYAYSKNNFLSVVNTVKSNLDFVKLLETTTTHKKGTTDIVIVDTFTYDHAGRMLTQKQKINSQPQETIAANTYDNLGQLITKAVGGTGTSVQTINYSYNIRGWLKNINDVNNIGTDLFASQIKYNDIADVSKKLYNGNISQTLWKTANSDSSLKNYTYTYDHLNRLTNAVDNLSKFNESLGYDKNGNITQLTRLGEIVGGSTIPDINIPSHFGTMDNLSYTYDSGNQLQIVSDSANDTYGFKDDLIGSGDDTTTDYTYDANGNMKTDTNKGITNINYNHLNLPTKITFATGSIDYFYDATGVKLEKKVVETNKPDVSTKYAGSFIYEKVGTGSDVLKFFSQPEGYVSNNSGTFDYIYQYRDHLGNVRLSYDKNLVIQEENNYYPFGLKHKGYNHVNNLTTGNSTAQKYKYNGKELQDEMGLNFYDYGARNYDPALGRWMNIDPLAEKSRRFNPYTYALDNPVYFIDPDGMEADHENGVPTAQLRKLRESALGADGLTDDQWMEASRPGADSEETKHYRQANRSQEIMDDKNGSIATASDAESLGALQDEPNIRKKKKKHNEPGGTWDSVGEGSVPYKGKAYWGTNFIGPGPDVDPYSLALSPVDEVDAAARKHDYAYYLAKTGGLKGALLDKSVTIADIALTMSTIRTIRGYHLGQNDDITNKPISERTYNIAVRVFYAFSGISAKKAYDLLN